MLCFGDLAGVFAQSGGQASLAFQGYYLGTGSQMTAETGLAIKFEEFLPGTGLWRGNLEAYRSGGQIQPADNYLQLRGLVWKGLRWNFNAGDFRAPGGLLPNPFTNLFFPEINARGFLVEAGDSRSSYSLFYGNETLLAGPRIPFRVSVPQRVLGASVRKRFGHLETGLRILRLVNTDRDAGQDSSPLSTRDFHSIENLTLYSAYNFSEHLKWYGETTVASAMQSAAPLSYLFGPSWESPRLTARFNYANLSRSYYPVAGYWVGDRKGPFGEMRVKPLEHVELFGSANRYETTSKPAENLPYMKSTGLSAGGSVELPWKLNGSVQLSLTDFHSSDPAAHTAQDASNRQWTGNLSRRIGVHTVRITARDMRLTANGLASRQRSAEVEDNFQIRHLLMGAGVRAQRSTGLERRNALYAHGTAQLNLGRLTASAFYEGGKDLANHTVFATSTVHSTSLSASYRLTRRWSVQGEAFRNRIVSDINPESLFVQGNQNLLLDPVLNLFSQWSFLFRVERTFNWCRALPAMGLDQFTASHIPITGRVEGAVYVLSVNGRRPAPAVTIRLESGRSATTDREGHYSLADVPEGAHLAALDLDQLPADFNPGPNSKVRIVIGPKKVAVADFDLYGLAGFDGKVMVAADSEFESLDGILIRLEPGGRYTTTTKDGGFAFYNVPEGDYVATIAAATLPKGARVRGADGFPVVIRTGTVPAAVRFEIEQVRTVEKPVRRVVDKVLDRSDPLFRPR